VFLGLRFGLGGVRGTLRYPSDCFLTSLSHGRDLTFGIRPFSFLIRRGVPPGSYLATPLRFCHGGVGPCHCTVPIAPPDLSKFGRLPMPLPLCGSFIGLPLAAFRFGPRFRLGLCFGGLALAPFRFRLGFG
jgi:hypothetical protein